MKEKIIKLLADQLNVNKTKINLESKIVEDLGADSLDVVELIMMLEDEFEVKVDEQKVLTLKTVKDILNLVEKKA